HHPQRGPLAGVHVQIGGYFAAQCAQCIADDLGFVGTEEHDVAVFGAQFFHDFQRVVVADELDDRRLQTFNAFFQLVDFDPGQTFATVNGNKVGVFVDLLTGQFGTARYFQCSHAALRIFGRAGEYFEVDVLQEFGNVDNFHRNTHIRLV